jgi:ABC-2 type transport system ATP-binding protein
MVGWWDKKVEELSKGMAQKVQFVVTVLHEPKLLIFDEPFSGFDPVNANMLKKEVLELKEKGATIIFSTHDMASVEELCDYITLIDKSKTILEGNVHDIKQKFKSNSYLIEFEGNPEDFQNSMHDNFEINSITSLPYDQFSALIKLSGTGKSNDLLRAATGSVSINTFRELLPSMNEIFIRAISENSIPVTHE